MGIRVIHVLTHDSIGLGEDGPTHQPVEQLAALRAVPNLMIFRPADATETAECWQIAITTPNRPSGLALTRQNLSAVRTEYSEKNLSAKGAYTLAGSDDAKVTIFASGSEVEIAVAARTTLEGKGISTRVVSFPAPNSSSSSRKPTAMRSSASRRSRSPSKPPSAKAGTPLSARKAPLSA